jgi:NAD(P)-dependent dehydrogenase (short-subunit alcohol dehydrogenase family)
VDFSSSDAIENESATGANDHRFVYFRFGEERISFVCEQRNCRTCQTTIMSQTILITGANRGIGLALTRELLSQGHIVIAASRNPEGGRELNALELKYAELFYSVKMDVNSDDSVTGAAELIAKEVLSLDVLVNNAAVFPENGDEPIADLDLQFFREAFETNVIGVVRVTRAFIQMLEKGKNPRVVNISSGAGSVAAKDDHGYYAYSASKAALNMVTRTMASELRGRNICTVALTPGWVKTDMGGPNASLTPEESASAIAKTITELTMKQTSHFIERTGAEVSCGW